MSTACFFNRLYNEDAIVRIGRFGIREAEIFFSARMEYTKEYISELKRVCDGEGVKVVSVHALPTHFEPQLFSRHGRQQAEAMEIFEAVLNAAHSLGAGVYVFHGPIHLKVARKPNINFKRVGERLTALCERAGEFGVALCYETVHWCWYSTPSFAKQLLRHTGTGNLYFTLDMKQAAQSGYPPAEYIEGMGGRLKHVHVCDYRIDPEKGVTPCLPFTGESDWQGLKASLLNANFDGHIMMEVYANNYKSYAQLARSYEEVKTFFNAPL